ncbi:Protein kinase domain-containing protein [Psidium guajava]|nr:Protein kinase domain-containing protein [Psidium guajava]
MLPRPMIAYLGPEGVNYKSLGYLSHLILATDGIGKEVVERSGQPWDKTMRLLCRSCGKVVTAPYLAVLEWCFLGKGSTQTSFYCMFIFQRLFAQAADVTLMCVWLAECQEIISVTDSNQDW